MFWSFSSQKRSSAISFLFPPPFGIGRHLLEEIRSTCLQRSISLGNRPLFLLPPEWATARFNFNIVVPWDSWKMDICSFCNHTKLCLITKPSGTLPKLNHNPAVQRNEAPSSLPRFFVLLIHVRRRRRKVKWIIGRLTEDLGVNYASELTSSESAPVSSLVIIFGRGRNYGWDHNK